MQLLSKIETPNENVKNQLAKLAELHENIVNDVAKDTRAIKLEAECNEFKDKLEIKENEFINIKQKYSKLKRDCYDQRQEVDKLITKYNKLKDKLTNMKDVTNENNLLKEEIKKLKNEKFNVNNNNNKNE